MNFGTKDRPLTQSSESPLQGASTDDVDSRNLCYLKQNNKRDLNLHRLATKLRMFAKWRFGQKKVKFLTENISRQFFYEESWSTIVNRFERESIFFNPIINKPLMLCI